MTPEEVQRTMDFILSSHANSAVRMDRLEEKQRSLHEDVHVLRESVQGLHEDVQVLKERVQVLVKTAHDFIRVSRGHLARTKKLEERADSADDMVRVIRELLEENLRRPRDPGDQRN